VRKTRIPYVTWNIERGVQYDRIVDALEALKPDIVILQEVDRYCRRSGNRDVASDLARTAGILVYSVHLESGGTDALRQRQLAEVLGAEAQQDSAPSIVAGDFNNSASFPSVLQGARRSWFCRSVRLSHW
jgi:endonuclease/exonuclease/phosphatase family metal-dependent hydrolase